MRHHHVSNVYIIFQIFNMTHFSLIRNEKIKKLFIPFALILSVINFRKSTDIYKYEYLIFVPFVLQTCISNDNRILHASSNQNLWK